MNKLNFKNFLFWFSFIMCIISIFVIIFACIFHNEKILNYSLLTLATGFIGVFYPELTNK